MTASSYLHPASQPPHRTKFAGMRGSDELLGFPSAKFDDQVDNTAQFLEWVQERLRISR